MIVVYSTNCPRCKILETKLNQKGITYEVCTDVDEMIALGLSSAPGLKIEDGPIMGFSEAVKWVNEQEV